MSAGKILVVDDEKHIVEMMRLRLEANDFTVAGAYSGPEALQVLEKQKDVEVVMTDIMMPGMDGVELLREMKKNYPDIGTIVITGFAALDTAIEAVRLGAYDYIKKPFNDVQALLHTVKCAVERKRLIVENRNLTAELKVSNEKLKKINLMLGDNVNELVMLHHIVESISGSVPYEQVVETFLKNIVEAMEFRKVLLFTVDEKQNIMELKSCVGIDRNKLGTVIFSLEDKAQDIVRALAEIRPLLLSGFQKDKDELISRIIAEDSRTIIYYPLRVREKAVGVLMLEGRKEVQIRKLHTLELYLNQAVLVMENARMFKRLLDINEELKEMDRLKSEFISTVSHELRTPLTAVKEGVSIVLDGIVGGINNRQERILEMSRRDVDRLARLIEDMLNISRIESGKVILSRSKVSPASLLERSFLSVKALAGEKAVRIETVLAPALPDVFVDEDRVIRVLVNLLSNAVKFSPEGSALKVSARLLEKEKLIEVSVTDQGIGIAAADQDRLFHKFSQIGRKAGPGYQGTGLGLAISKEIVEMHGGRDQQDHHRAGVPSGD